jgi:hypothetical protein
MPGFWRGDFETRPGEYLNRQPKGAMRASDGTGSNGDDDDYSALSCQGTVGCALLRIFPQVGKCWCKKVTSKREKKRRDDVEDLPRFHSYSEAGFPPYLGSIFV